MDKSALTYAEIMALATGNPYIQEKMELGIQVLKLKLMKANHMSQKYRLEDDISMKYPQKISYIENRMRGLQSDMEMCSHIKAFQADRKGEYHANQ